MTYSCAKCLRTLRPVKNDVTVEELDHDGAPYRIWSMDLWGCDGCGAQVLLGSGHGPVAEHYQAERYATFAPDVTHRIGARP